MKLREYVVVLLAVAALGAGPPPQVPPAQRLPPEPPSAWNKLKSGARRLLPGAESPAAQGDVRYDDQVRQATAVAPQPVQPRRRPFFKGPVQPKRTLSEYMAWEKP